jgi:hypothetical protein
MRGKRVVILAAALSLAAATAAAEAPSMHSTWKATKLSQSACMDRANRLLASGGFTDLQRGNFSIFAQQGGYSIIISCLGACPTKDALFESRRIWD